MLPILESDRPISFRDFCWISGARLQKKGLTLFILHHYRVPYFLVCSLISDAIKTLILDGPAQYHQRSETNI